MSTSTETHPANTVFEEYFSAPFTPTVDGVYTVTALATDPLSGTALITGTAFVDTTPPTASLDRSRFNHASYSLGTGLSLSGIASDTAGLLTAAAQLDFGGPVAPLALRLGATGAPAGYLNGQAVFTLTTWTATWWTLGRPPDNITATLKLALVDVSQNAVTVTFPITLDVAPPAIGDISLLARAGR